MFAPIVISNYMLFPTYRLRFNPPMIPDDAEEAIYKSLQNSGPEKIRHIVYGCEACDEIEFPCMARPSNKMKKQDCLQRTVE